MDGLNSILRWLPVPDDSLDDEVQQFAMAYNGYSLHGPGYERLHRAIAHVIDMEDRRLLTVEAPTEDLRAALFALGRWAAHAWGGDETITSQTATLRILDELRRRQPKDPFISVAPSAHLRGYTPPEHELPSLIERSLGEIVLLSALNLASQDSDRLAWLALTSKAEHAIRDIWGWALHLGLPRHSVTREWKRTDLAILDGDQPRALIEGKAIYGFDALNPKTRDKYAALVKADLEKAVRLAPEAFHLATLLVSTVTSSWDPNRTASVAYAAGNATTAAGGAGMADRTAELMWDALAPLGAVGVANLGVGTAFGATVDTRLFLVRPRAPRGSGGTDRHGVGREGSSGPLADYQALFAPLWALHDVVSRLAQDDLATWHGGDQIGTTTEAQGGKRPVIRMPYVSYHPAVEDLIETITRIARSLDAADLEVSEHLESNDRRGTGSGLGPAWATVHRIIRTERFNTGAIGAALSSGVLSRAIEDLRRVLHSDLRTESLEGR